MTPPVPPVPPAPSKSSFWKDAVIVVRLRLLWHQHLRDVAWSEDARAECEAIEQEIERIRDLHWSRTLVVECVRGMEQVNPVVWLLLLWMLGAAIYSLLALA